MAWHPSLRARLARTLADAGPDGPTLCAGWRTRHLAAHLVLRQSEPLYDLALLAPPLADRAEARVQALAGSADDETGYASLIARVAAAPPVWHPLRWAGDAGDLLELTVHTLDVTRAAGLTDPDVDPGLVDAIWAGLVRTAPRLLRHVPTGLILVRPDGPRARVRRPGNGSGTVAVRGSLADLALFCFGRRDAAHVTLEGAADDLGALAGA
ncbi:MAG: maleylpyruvate isomerase family mycothiol-dependent enzyme [Cellulomonas sp.]|nr:maleylpyruvate isomerase family mycothiol-dependent enzyme [Cellulomonas sp.]